MAASTANISFENLAGNPPQILPQSVKHPCFQHGNRVSWLIIFYPKNTPVNHSDPIFTMCILHHNIHCYRCNNDLACYLNNVSSVYNDLTFSINYRCYLR